MRIDNNTTDVIIHQQYNPTTLKQGNWQTIYYKEKGQLKIYRARGETNLVVDYFTKHHPRFPSSISQNYMHIRIKILLNKFALNFARVS